MRSTRAMTSPITKTQQRVVVPINRAIRNGTPNIHFTSTQPIIIKFLTVCIHLLQLSTVYNSPAILSRISTTPLFMRSTNYISSSFFQRNVDAWSHLPYDAKLLSSLHSFKWALNLVDISVFVMDSFLVWQYGLTVRCMSTLAIRQLRKYT